MGVAEQLLIAEIVPRRVEGEQAVAPQQRLPLGLELGRLALQVDADAGEDAASSSTSFWL